MSGAMPPLPNTPLWLGAQLKKEQGQLNLYFYLIFIRSLNQKPMRWTGCVAYMEEVKKACKYFGGKHGVHWGSLSICEMRMLKWMLGKQNVKCESDLRGLWHRVSVPKLRALQMRGHFKKALY
jgi:hypothetical protein